MVMTMSSRILVRNLAPHLLSTSTGAAAAGDAWTHALLKGAPARGAVVWARVFPVRMASTTAAAAAPGPGPAVEGAEEKSGGAAREAPASEKKAVTSYWGVEQRKLAKEDGTDWRWSCFRPWETYKADVTIDLEKHHVPTTLLDKVAYWTVKSLRIPTDIFFQTVWVPGDDAGDGGGGAGDGGGMLLHLRSLRRFEHSGGWIRALLEEAENERMHLMTFMEVAKPRWYERALVIAVQGVFFNAYFLGYLLSPKFAHRVTGYLEEEAIHSYTEFLRDLDAGKIDNVPAPAIAIDYWRLPPDATLKDVVTVVRADEAHHRDVNHFASDIHYQGMELKETPAPLDYH
uniref:Ubiquinol oxidase n=1 Tax=Ananas comosus var. bracteatus TaxID=296719 RepID=A0A6V7QXQ8_ANACO